MTKEGGEDILGASPRNLWSALSLSEINDMLSKPLSAEDVRFNQVTASVGKANMRLIARHVTDLEMYQ